MKKYTCPKADIMCFDVDTIITQSTQTTDGPIAAWQKSYDGAVATVAADTMQDVFGLTF